MQTQREKIQLIKEAVEFIYGSDVKETNVFVISPESEHYSFQVCIVDIVDGITVVLSVTKKGSIFSVATVDQTGAYCYVIKLKELEKLLLLALEEEK